MGAEWGVCITGQLRSLLSLPVHSTFVAHVLSVLPAADVFVALSHATGELPKPIEDAITNLYSPIRLMMHATKPSWRPCRPHRMGMNPDLVLAQWVNIALCYRAVTSHEERRGRSYGWLLRTRTDLVYLAPFPFAAFRRDRAYVPVGGMNPCVSPKSIPRSAVS